MVPSIPKEQSSRPSPIPRAHSIGPKHWQFAFSFWQQREFFGLENAKVDVGWFVALLNRLKELSNKTMEEILNNPAERDAWRFHPINWQQPNCPLTEEQFKAMIPERFHTEDMEIFQFMISQANGRVVGFLDYSTTFQIIILDSLHNLQPSKDYNYNVNPTRVALTSAEETEQKLIALKRRLDEKCAKGPCDLLTQVNEILGPTRCEHRFFCLNDFAPYTEIQVLADRHGSIEDVILAGLGLLLEQENQNLSPQQI